jgi:NOL1/NOP2/fmu family ribosome biogenesis protein
LSNGRKKKIDELSSIQRDLLSLMAPLIRDNGIIIYSTCTHALEEDEKNVEWFLEQFPAFEQVQIDLEEAWGISNQIAAEHYPEIVAAYRMFFHKARGEGFFFSVFRKKEGHAGRFKNSKKNTTSLKPLDNKTKALFTSFLNHPEDFELRKDGDEIYALPIKYVDDILILDSQMRLIKKGIHLGTSKGKKWIPTHDFALSNIIKRSAFPIIKIGHEDALRYYKGMNLESENKLEQGWALIEHNDNILGWVKVLPNRINNHLPKGWEIRKPLEF